MTESRVEAAPAEVLTPMARLWWDYDAASDIAMRYPTAPNTNAVRAARRAIEQAVSEKARDEERRVWKSVAENAADWLWARGTASDGLAADLDHADALRARLAASPTEEANRG